MQGLGSMRALMVELELWESQVVEEIEINMKDKEKGKDKDKDKEKGIDIKTNINTEDIE